MEKKANIWANFVSAKLVHEKDRADGTGTFVNVSIPCTLSKSGYASMALNAGQVKPATAPKSKKVVDGMVNILLGDPDAKRKVSVATNKKKTNFKQVELTNAEIAQLFADNRTAYEAAQETAEA